MSINVSAWFLSRKSTFGLPADTLKWYKWYTVVHCRPQQTCRTFMTIKYCSLPHNVPLFLSRNCDETLKTSNILFIQLLHWYTDHNAMNTIDTMQELVIESSAFLCVPFTRHFIDTLLYHVWKLILGLKARDNVSQLLLSWLEILKKRIIPLNRDFFISWDIISWD